MKATLRINRGLVDIVSRWWMAIVHVNLKGVVVNYRRGPRTQRSRECLIQFPNVRSRSEANQLIGRKIAWMDEKKNIIIGTITMSHGNKGLVRARFRRGLPGQALKTLVRIVG